MILQEAVAPLLTLGRSIKEVVALAGLLEPACLVWLQGPLCQCLPLLNP